ncbi:hypothetical protein B0T24DRAFT_657098 [Lasiosphaeria ovina]|uniref:Uncharacterized protein n=1 Tax=Lasiosphaeria ovina TaxID=92902 RepID=A0AAE0N850_9PEZI|nr:hypothetical protein B0T24DRAFT_657098 [Lasiosphaeria ovina]
MESRDAAYEGELKQSLTTKTKAMPEQPDKPPETETKWTPPAATKAWLVLFVHAACCVSLALAMALGLDGYKAGDGSNPRYVDGKLLLRVSDITTIISVAVVVIKAIIGFWSAVVLWAFARYMLAHKTRTVSHTRATVFQMIRDFPGWTILAAVIVVMIQAHTSPVLTSSVNWDAAFHISHDAVSLSWVDPGADSSSWYWHNRQGYFDKRASTSGNGCCQVVNDIGLPRHSVLFDATLPCINVSNIRWHHPADELTGDEWSVTLAYDGNNLRHDINTSDTSTATAQPPAANKFSGTMTVALMIARMTYSLDPPCEQLNNTKFGDMRKLPYLMETTKSTAANENYFLLGKIDFVAGVTKSSLATYISPHVVEDIKPMQDVVFEPNSWTQEAIWLLPDLMTMLAVSNVAVPPTFDNIENYVRGLVTQGYLGAWDMLSHSFDSEGPSYNPIFRFLSISNVI